MNFDPIRPYLGLLRAGVGAALLVAAFVGGCSHGKAKLQGKLAAEQAAHKATRGALDGANAAIDEINAEAKRRLKAAEDAKQAAQDAGQAAEAARQRIARDLSATRAEIARLRRARPACDALLSTDLEAVCGL